jgi:hypothetical protein
LETLHLNAPYVHLRHFRNNRGAVIHESLRQVA